MFLRDVKIHRHHKRGGAEYVRLLRARLGLDDLARRAQRLIALAEAEVGAHEPKLR